MNKRTVDRMIQDSSVNEVTMRYSVLGVNRFHSLSPWSEWPLEPTQCPVQWLRDSFLAEEPSRVWRLHIVPRQNAFSFSHDGQLYFYFINSSFPLVQIASKGKGKVSWAPNHHGDKCGGKTHTFQTYWAVWTLVVSYAHLALAPYLPMDDPAPMFFLFYVR